MAGADGPRSPVFQLRLVAPDSPEPVASDKVEKMTAVAPPGRSQASAETVYVEKKVLFDETDLKRVAVSVGPPSNQPQIDFEFTGKSQKRFAEVTRQNVGRRLAIVIDGKLYSAPVIRTEIAGGKGQITGNFTQEEAKQLSDKINAALKK